MSRKRLLVEKRNILNDIIMREFTLQELRLFSVYLGRINARDLSTRQVRLPLKEFYKVMDLQPVRVEYLKEVTHNLLTKVVCVPTPAGGYSQFQLFKECRVEKDAYEQWYFEIDAHDKALQLMFDYKRDYFTYELWNVLNLESINQFRMYEILKQCEWRGERIITVGELKALLGIKEKEYLKFNDFKRFVLNACQTALKEKTDICFTYEPYARSGRGGRIQALRFVIAKNVDYKDRIRLKDFIGAKIIERVRQEEGPEQGQEPGSGSEQDVSSLGFIQEPLSDRDKLFVLQAADGDVALVKTAYNMAIGQGGINSLTGWLIVMIRKLQKGEASPPVNVKRQTVNRFNNFEGRNYTPEQFKEFERLELEQLKASMKD